MSTPDRRGMLDQADEKLSIRRQCELIGVARSGFYRGKTPAADDGLALMKRLDQLFTERPFYGSRRMTLQLRPALRSGPCEACSPQASGSLRGPKGRSAP